MIPPRGFIHMELMLLIAFGGIGAAFGLPPLLKLFQGASLSTWEQARMLLGALLVLAGFWPFISARLNREDPRKP